MRNQLSTTLKKEFIIYIIIIIISMSLSNVYSFK